MRWIAAACALAAALLAPADVSRGGEESSGRTVGDIVKAWNERAANLRTVRARWDDRYTVPAGAHDGLRRNGRLTRIGFQSTAASRLHNSRAVRKRSVSRSEATFGSQHPTSVWCRAPFSPVSVGLHDLDRDRTVKPAGVALVGVGELQLDLQRVIDCQETSDFEPRRVV